MYSPAESTPLTPEQSADVIRYFHAANNAETRARGYRDKVLLGVSAVQAGLKRESLLPSDQPMLTFKEVGEGLDYLVKQTSNRVLPITPPRSDEDRDWAERAAGERFD